MGYIDQIDGNNSYLEMAGDFFISPSRLFFGNTYRLEEGYLKHHETFLSLSNTIARVAAIVLLPLSAISTLFGLLLKSIAYSYEPALKAKFSLPILYNARMAENFQGILPKNPWTPNCVNSQEKSFWGKLYDVDPIQVSAEEENPTARMKNLLLQLNAPNFKAQNCHLVEEKGNYLHYEYTVIIPEGPLKGTYIDDLDLYYDLDNKCFQIRSASRTGFRDAVNLDFNQMGANKKRIEAIRQAFR